MRPKELIVGFKSHTVTVPLMSPATMMPLASTTGVAETMSPETSYPTPPPL